MLNSILVFLLITKRSTQKASCQLGVCYELGIVLDQNLEKAFQFYEDASHSHAYAMNNLGMSLFESFMLVN